MNIKKMDEGIMIISVSALGSFTLIDYLIPNVHLTIACWLIGLSFGIALQRRFLK